MVELAEKNKNIVAITASMKDGTGLTEFQKRFPERFFDIGIAEQHAITLAAGMAKEGLIPVVPIYASFYQRAYDQVIHDVAIQNLPVVMCVDRAGLVGADGETHQGLLDMAFFRLVPNLTIMAPKDFKELEDMLTFAVEFKKPIVIRYPRGGEDATIQFEKHDTIRLGKCEIIKEFEPKKEETEAQEEQQETTSQTNQTNQENKVTIMTIGKTAAKGMKLAKELEEQNKNVQVINMRFLKPIDRSAVIEASKQSQKLITIEDGTIVNGLATAVKEIIAEEKLANIDLETHAYPDAFIEHGSVEELEAKYWDK